MTAGVVFVDTDDLPPTQYLICEVLAARWRTGKTTWTFPARFRPQMAALADAGLIGWKSGVEPRTVLAWLTEAGRAAAMSETYEPPAEEVTEHWAVRKSSVVDGEGVGIPYQTRAEAEAKLARLAEKIRELPYPVELELVHRTLRWLPNGMPVVGAWTPAPSSDGKTAP